MRQRDLSIKHTGVFIFVVLAAEQLTAIKAWVPPKTQLGKPIRPAFNNRIIGHDGSTVASLSRLAGLKAADEEEETQGFVLMEMDVVIYSEKGAGKRKLGAVQEDGRITPLCAWTAEPAFDEFMELLVDEEDLLPGYRVEDGAIEIHSVVPENLLSYGSRQVNGGMGLGNPHGEESEMLYYIHQSIVDDVEIEVNPDLEVFW